MGTPHDIIKVKSSKNYLSLLNREDDFRVRYVDSNHTVVTSDGVWDSHTQVSYEIILLNRGKYKCLLDDFEIELNPWDMLIVQAGQKHEDFLYKGCSMFAFHFHLLPASDGKLPPSVFAPGVKPVQQKLHLEDKAFFLFLIRNLITQNREAKDGFEYFHLHNAIFGVIFRKILLLYSKNILHETISQQINIDLDTSKIYSVFSRHLADMPGLEQLCHECGTSRSALHRLCQQLFNMPPRKAFIHYKILQIQNFMIKHPGMRIKELSEMFGFKNPFHFSRVFRQETGTYPSNLIKQKKH